MSYRWCIFLSAVAVSALLYFSLKGNGDEQADSEEPVAETARTEEPDWRSDETASLITAKKSEDTIPHEPDDRLERLADGRVKYLPALKLNRDLESNSDPEEALSIIRDLLEMYRYAYRENPVGVDNSEITEQLLGKNPKNVVFISQDSRALRGNELVDQWGTPYFFHPLSAEEMEIRSAGPDQEIWTEDDITSDLYGEHALNL